MKSSFIHCWPGKMVLKYQFKEGKSVQRGLPSGLEVKYPPVVQETRVQSLGQEYPLEEGMATHSSILVGKIPWTQEPGRLQSMGSQRVRQDSDFHSLEVSLTGN